MSFQAYESTSRPIDMPCKSDNTQKEEKSKATDEQSNSMAGKSPKRSDKKA